MEYALARCDRDHAPAYLESSNPRNIPFYRRYGFEPLGAIQVGSSPTLVPMLRGPVELRFDPIVCGMRGPLQRTPGRGRSVHLGRSSKSQLRG